MKGYQEKAINFWSIYLILLSNTREFQRRKMTFKNTELINGTGVFQAQLGIQNSRFCVASITAIIK